MNSINISQRQLSVSHRGLKINIKGEFAKILIFGIAILVLITGLSSVLKSFK